MHSETHSARRAKTVYHHPCFRFLSIVLTIVLIICIVSMGRKEQISAIPLWQNPPLHLLYVVYKLEKSMPTYTAKAVTIRI